MQAFDACVWVRISLREADLAKDEVPIDDYDKNHIENDNPCDVWWNRLFGRLFFILINDDEVLQFV